ncbi:MAG: arginine repressor [Micrococcaceae bacterium]
MKRTKSKVARHDRIKELITNNAIHSQFELADLLKKDGYKVTQTTLSRDLVELGAAKIRSSDNSLIYAIPAEGLSGVHQADTSTSNRKDKMISACQEFLIGAEGSLNMCVLRTPPGAAQFLAASIDHSLIPKVIGTIAGDDTVLLVCREDYPGQKVADYLVKLSSK